MTLSIEPPTEEFADWMAEKMGSAGGRLSPSNLNDRSFPREVKSKLRGMDSGYGSTSHTVAVSFPRQEITYACIKHWRCVGGRWVEGHTEIREVSRRDLSPQAFTDTGHMNSSEVERIVGRAVSAYQQLARNADRVERMCE